MKRNLFIRVICLLLLCSLFSPLAVINISASPYSEGLPDISRAQNVYFANIDTGRVIARKDTNTKIAPASTVKIMTGLIALEYFEEKLDTPITITIQMLTSSVGTNMRLGTGDILSAEELIYGVICGGYNDAAYALAYAISENDRDFVSMMNKKAKELGAQNTLYTNPTGMDDPNMYTTLSDTVMIAKAARKNPDYMRISSAPSREISFINDRQPITIHNRNSLLASYYSQGYLNKSAGGMIAGMTDAGGYCLVTEAFVRGATYLCIVMGAESAGEQIYSYEIANSLITYAKENLGFREILGQNVSICDIPIDFALADTSGKESDTASVSAVTADAVKAFLPLSADISKITYKYYLYNERLAAPIAAGTRVGGIDFYYNGEIIATAPLIINNDVASNEVSLKIHRLKKTIASRTSIISLLIFALLSFIWFYFFDHKRQRKRTQKIKYRNY